jgi:hypothetical protein
MPPRRKKTQEDDSVALQLERLQIEKAAREREEAAREREEAARVRQHELQLAQLQAQQAAPKPQCHWRIEAFPTFDEDKDSIETFLEGFERRARLASDDQVPWVLWLGQVFCKGKVGEVYCRAARDPNTTYAEVKEARLAHFHITPEEYRRKFRNLRPTSKEMPQQFSRVLARSFDQWLEASNVKDFEKLKELMLSKLIMKCYAPDERIFVRQSQARDWDSVVSALEAYMSARQYDSKTTKTKPQSSASSDDQRDDTTGGARRSDKDIECYKCKEKGHVAKLCPREKVEKSGGCAPARRMRRDLVLRDDATMYPVAEGLVEGKKCQALRDTGCGCVIVQRDLVPPTKMRKATCCLSLIDGSVKQYPTARVSIKCPYLCGVVEVVVMDQPLYPCVIGNVDGAAGAEFRQQENVKFVDAGRENPPVQGNRVCQDDTSSSSRPITLMEAINDEGLKEAATTPVSGPADVGGVGGRTPPPTTEPVSRVQEPSTSALPCGAGSSSTSAEGVDTCCAGGPDRGLSDVDGSPPSGVLSPQPAAAVPFASAAIPNPPLPRELCDTDGSPPSGVLSPQPVAGVPFAHAAASTQPPTTKISNAGGSLPSHLSGLLPQPAAAAHLPETAVFTQSPTSRLTNANGLPLSGLLSLEPGADVIRAPAAVRPLSRGATIATQQSDPTLAIHRALLRNASCPPVSLMVVPGAVRPEIMRYLDSVLFANRAVPNASTHFFPFEHWNGRTTESPWPSRVTHWQRR